MTLPANIRKHFVDWVAVLADSAAQVRYEQGVPHAAAHIELFETFYDLYFPADIAFVAAFTKEEVMGLVELESLLETAAKRSKAIGVHSVSQLQGLPEWQSVVRHAGAIHQTLKKEANQPPEPMPLKRHGSS